VVFQEFSNEERCKAAKSSLEGQLKGGGSQAKKWFMVVVMAGLAFSTSALCQGTDIVGPATQPPAIL
jgi:hypothetical protein